MKKVFSFLLVAILLVSTFAGCGKPVDQNNNVVNGAFSEYLVAEKVGTIDKDNFTTADGGIYYEDENGLFGVMSLNGVYDTGAIYTRVDPEGEYFYVRTKEIANKNDLAGINSAALIDGKGRTIIPEGYACFRNINGRYIQVSKATEITYLEDDAILSISEFGAAYKGAVDDCDWYKGTWYVYDTVTKKMIPGVQGSTDEYVAASGRYIQYNDDNGNRQTVDENGEPLPKNAKLFSNGSYAIEEKTGSVYSENGELLFNYDLAGYKPSSFENGYYIANQYIDGITKHTVLDNTGKTISAEFEDYIDVYGDVVLCGDKIYNLKGENIIEGSYESIYYDKMFGQNWFIENEEYYTLIDKNGTVFFNGAYDDDHYISYTDFLMSEEKDDDTYYYSFKDMDFSINGFSFAPWIVQTNSSNGLYDLVDTMTGKKLLEGYKDYSNVSRNSMAYYVYAEYEGGADVYLVVSSAQLEDVAKKKAGLFDDLSAAFEKEGITVTVNKENGEIAMDSSVLFGGDSAELTADGKAFLNKFMKAYTTVVYSDEYNGFISKTMVEGHTAPLANSTYASGLQLSEERAENVKSYCLSKESGVNASEFADAFEAVGYSNSKPVYNDAGEVDLEASRRVSFRFMVNIEF